jgi:hypothetical protein
MGEIKYVIFGTKTVVFCSKLHQNARKSPTFEPGFCMLHTSSGA